MPYAGTPSDERDWIFAKILAGKTSRPGRKPAISFKVGDTLVCRAAWCTLLGMNQENARVRRLVAKVRRGVTSLPKTAVAKSSGLTATDLAVAFVADYMWKHSQKSPTHQILYVERPPDAISFYDQYVEDMHKGSGQPKKKHLSKGVFLRVWAQVMLTGIVEPHSGTHYEVQHRCRRARGFGECDICAQVSRGRGSSHAREHCTHLLTSHPVCCCSIRRAYHTQSHKMPSVSINELSTNIA